MASIYEDIIKRLDSLAVDIAALTINEGSGAAGGAVTGSGTTNRITQWTGTSSLGDSTLIKTGAGILTLAAAADYTLTVPATGTAAMGAGTLTVATTSDATIAAHTHAITSSSNPGAAAAILASNASGYLRLLRIGLGMAPSFPLDVTGQGRLVATSTADANTVGFVANLTKTAGVDDTRTNSAFQTTLTLAGTFAYSGVNSGMTATLNHGGSGLASDLSGIYFIGGVTSTGNVTQFDIIRARPFGAGAGVIGTLICFRAYDMAATGTPTTSYGLRIDASTGAVGTSKYGIYVQNISGAATNNYALFTNAGLNQLGDQLKVDGSADRIQEIVQAHSTQTANLTEWQASTAAVQAYITGTGGAVFNEAGTATGDLRAESDTEPDMVFLDASADALYLGGQTNGIKIEKGGELTLIGTATRWDDLRIEPVERNTGAKAPSFVSWVGGLYLYDFDDALAAAEKELFFTVQLPHTWKEGSAVEPHIHWTNKTAGTAGQVIRWGIEYTKAVIGGTFSSSPTTVYATTIAGGGDITVANEHMLTDFASIDMTGDTISTVLVCRIFRNSSNAADTYTGTAGLLYLDWHYEIDAMGSKTELAK